MRSIDDIIRKAMERGEFNNLRGKGRPLHLDENLHEDPEWRLAKKILRDSGFSPPWIENYKEIRGDLEKARAYLGRAWQLRGESILGDLPDSEIENEWNRAQKTFREQIEQINQRIFHFNLQAPSILFQMNLLDVDREISKIIHTSEDQPPV